MLVRDHADCIECGARLAADQYADHCGVKTIAPAKVISVLSRSGVRAVLVGTHGNAGWIQKPRATQDVDVAVAKRNISVARRVLASAFPRLETEDRVSGVVLVDPLTRRELIDVKKAEPPLYVALASQTRTVTVRRVQVRVPSLEMALAMKFIRLTDPSWGLAEWYMDSHDVIRMVEVNPALDLATLARLGNRIRRGGGKQILELVSRIRAGASFIEWLDGIGRKRVPTNAARP